MRLRVVMKKINIILLLIIILSLFLMIFDKKVTHSLTLDSPNVVGGIYESENIMIVANYNTVETRRGYLAIGDFTLSYLVNGIEQNVSCDWLFITLMILK